MKLQSNVQTTINIIVMLAVIWMAIAGSFNRMDKLITIEQNPSVTLTQCQHNQQIKITVLQICEKNSQSFCLALPGYLHLFQSLSGIILSLFIIALLAMGLINRIFKPPQSLSFV